jgi:NhaP-type Na+/H+ and K+/H+ antiporter
MVDKKLLPMEQGLRYMNTILVFLTVGLLIFSAYPMIIGGGLMIAILIFVLAGIVALATFIYTGEFKRET